MLSKTEYNSRLESIYKTTLVQRGYRKNGIHYYKVNPSNQIVMQIRNGWSMSYEIILCFGWSGQSNFKDKNGKLNVPKSMFKFPIAFSINNLKQQFNSHSQVSNFKIDLNPITNYIFSTQRIVPLDFKYIINQFKPFTKHLTENYLNKSINLILNYENRLFEQINIDSLYLATIKYPEELKNVSNDPLKLRTRLIKLNRELKEEVVRQKIELPKTKRTKFEKFYIKRHYKKLNK